MAIVILGVGIPASGKTTVLKPFAEKYSFTYISPDDIRGELLGNTNDQTQNKKVWEEAYKRLSESLAQGETIVFDATFAKHLERKDFIKFACAHGAQKIYGVFAKVLREVAHERNQSRDRVVPERAIDRMHAMLTQNPPHTEEGFDKIYKLDEIAKVDIEGLLK